MESEAIGGELELALVEAAVRLVASADLATCGHGELDVLGGALQRVRGFVSVHEVRVARRRDELATATLGALTTAGGATADGSAGSGGPGAAGGSEGAAAPPATGSGASGGGPATVDGAPLELGGFAGASDRRPGRETEGDRVRARVCAAMPELERALAAGRIDAAHVDAVAAVWADLGEEERVELIARAELLVGCAAVESPERFRRRVRDLGRRLAGDHGRRVAQRQREAQRVRRWTDARSGMGHLHVELDPEQTGRVWAALDERLAEWRARADTAGVPLGSLEVEAFVELVTSSSALDARAAELVVLVDVATLETGAFGPGAVCETVDGGALSPDAARRLACDARIVPLVLGGHRVPLDAGRARRLASREQRQALAAMYATCAMPSCQVRVSRCRVHHVEPWLPSGATDLANLVPVCDRHHHLVHEGGWTLTMSADRVITLRAPDGTVRFHGDTRDRVPAELVGDPDERAEPWEQEPPPEVERRTVDLARARLASLRRRARCTGGSRDTEERAGRHVRTRRGP